MATAAAVALLALAGTSAAAQAPEEQRARKAAACVTRSDYLSAEAIALSYPGAELERVALTQPRVLRCLERNGLASDSPMFPVFAGEVSRRIYVSRTQRFFSRVIVTDPVAAAAYRARPTVAKRIAGPEDAAVLAACLVHVDPNFGDALMRAKPGSEKEALLFAQAMQSMSACVEQGTQIRFKRNLLEAEIIRAFYRYICAPKNFWG